MELNLRIPPNIYLALKVPEKDKERILLIELAVSLYQREILSFGKAREFAQMDKWQFHEELAKRNIPRHYNLENVKEDFEYGEN